MNRYLVYRWNNQEYALKTSEIISVIGVDTMVKTSKKEIKIALKEKDIIPVLDPITTFTLEEAKLSKTSKILICYKKGIVFGMLVDEILGVEEVKKKNVETATIDEKRFVEYTFKGVKVVDLNTFLTRENLNLFKKATQIEIDLLKTGYKAHTQKTNQRNKDFLLDTVQTEVLNLLLKASNKNDQEYAAEITKIHQMIEKII